MIENFLIDQVKKKKELSALDDSIVLKALERQVRKWHFDLTNLKKRETKTLIKLAREELRVTVGSFNLTRGSKEINLNEKLDLLNLHTSTKERAPSYPFLVQFIRDLNIKSILDLGCGLNPIALANTDYIYYAADINMENINLLNRFFKHNNIQGKAFIFDLRDIEKNNLPTADLCLLFKVLDVIEKKGHKLAEKLVKSINCRYFLISFSTKTLSGKPMNHPQRGWIEQMLTRLGYSYNLIKQSNEIFYFFEKNHPVNAL